MIRGLGLGSQSFEVAPQLRQMLDWLVLLGERSTLRTSFGRIHQGDQQLAEEERCRRPWAVLQPVQMLRLLEQT